MDRALSDVEIDEKVSFSSMKLGGTTDAYDAFVPFRDEGVFDVV